jgi:hypothetical protein
MCPNRPSCVGSPRCSWCSWCSAWPRRERRYVWRVRSSRHRGVRGCPDPRRRAELLLLVRHPRREWSDVPVDLPVPGLAAQTQDVEPLGGPLLPERLADLVHEASQAQVFLDPEVASYWQMSGLSLLLPDYIDRDLHRRNRSSVLKPVCGVPILGPAHSRPIVRSDSISMVGDRSLQYEDDAWSVFMVVNRAEDASRLDGHHTHSKLAPCHALDLRAKVNRCK